MLKKRGSRVSDRCVEVLAVATGAIRAVAEAPGVAGGVGEEAVGCGVTVPVDLAMTIIPATSRSHTSNI